MRGGYASRSDRRGAALALALWVLLVLGMAALQVLAAVRSRVDTAAFLRARTVGRYAAESGIEAARARLEELVRGAPSEAEQALVFDRFRQDLATWGAVPIESGRYQVVVENLGARVDLNRSSPLILRGLFAQFVSEARAEELVRTLRGTDALDDLAPVEEGIPPEVAEALAAEGVTLRHLESLTRVPGFDDALATALAPYLTVSGDGLVDVNAAPPAVLAAVPYVGPIGARALIAARERSGPLTSRVAVYSAMTEGGGSGFDSRMPDLITAPRRVLIVARGWEDGRPQSHEVQAVLEVLASSLVVGSRLRLRAWTERSR